MAAADVEIAEEAVRLRRRRRIRLPDALVWATARRRGALLVTRNTKDFPKDDPGVRVPYTLLTRSDQRIVRGPALDAIRRPD